VPSALASALICFVVSFAFSGVVSCLGLYRLVLSCLVFWLSCGLVLVLWWTHDNNKDEAKTRKARHRQAEDKKTKRQDDKTTTKANTRQRQDKNECILGCTQYQKKTRF
jgi:hypothetical protein